MYSVILLREGEVELLAGFGVVEATQLVDVRLRIHQRRDFPKPLHTFLYHPPTEGDPRDRSRHAGEGGDLGAVLELSLVRPRRVHAVEQLEHPHPR